MGKRLARTVLIFTEWSEQRDQSVQWHKQYPMSRIHRFHAKSYGQMSFSYTRRSHVFAALHERQTSQFPNNLTVDARLEGKVELLQRFDPRQTSLLQPGLHTALMPAVPFLL